MISVGATSPRSNTTITYLNELSFNKYLNTSLNLSSCVATTARETIYFLCRLLKFMLDRKFICRLLPGPCETAREGSYGIIFTQYGSYVILQINLKVRSRKIYENAY